MWDKISIISGVLSYLIFLCIILTQSSVSKRQVPWRIQYFSSESSPSILTVAVQIKVAPLAEVM